jgi:hypothetical protein
MINVVGTEPITHLNTNAVQKAIEIMAVSFDSDFVAAWLDLSAFEHEGRSIQPGLRATA